MATRFLARCRTVNFRALVPLDLLQEGRAQRHPSSGRRPACPPRPCPPRTVASADSASARLPTRIGTFDAVVYSDSRTGTEPIALVHGDVAGRDAPLVRLHSECWTGRRAGLASMRLRRAARPRADRDRRRRRRRADLPQAGGSRDRAGEQAAGVRAPGRRARHRRREHRARPAGRCPRVRCRRRDPRRPRVGDACG